MVNATTFPLIREDLAASLLAGLCGANRGLFVTRRPVMCTAARAFPPQWAPNQKVKHCASTGLCQCDTWDANAVVRQFDGGNLTAEAVRSYMSTTSTSRRFTRRRPVRARIRERVARAASRH